ncbi:Glyoxalase-like domain-containing protein [Brevibacterium siliguriense]|uniref:Glyoxalase-like domain-containing protein n=1 Tax=Brevibacterium siliguriense TaxID=1136497 RepID=A0A1H1XDE2_9MICO|nr:VOC family protein [Brevibacterium siliguriense]SDT07323.1 Glyoxalase-like domain-containing protein [Brevibacterium siliguriense]
MLSNSRFDHLVIAVPDLQGYVEQSATSLGVEPVDGGAHLGLGTANALLGLELADELTESLGLARPSCSNPLTYLEILGPDPEQDPALAASRLAGITEPTVQRWAIRPDDFDGLVTAAARSQEPRVRLGEVHDMTRRRPDGTVLDFFGIALDIIAPGGQEGETEGLHAHLKGPGGSWTL